MIDRTFVDEKGIRWIIDYKTSAPRDGEDVAAFLAAEKERYRPQLAIYAELFQCLEPQRPVRAGLYFPMLDAWCELEGVATRPDRTQPFAAP